MGQKKQNLKDADSEDFGDSKLSGLSDFVVEPSMSGIRLDVCVAKRFTEYSREVLKTAIQEGVILLDGKLVRPSQKLQFGQIISVDLSWFSPKPLKPECIDIDVLYEDDDVLIVKGVNVFPSQIEQVLLEMLFEEVIPAATEYSGMVARSIIDKKNASPQMICDSVQELKDLKGFNYSKVHIRLTERCTQEQMNQLKSMGDIGDIAGMIPGIDAKALKGAKVDEKSMTHAEAIILSMTEGVVLVRRLR